MTFPPRAHISLMRSPFSSSIRMVHWRHLIRKKATPGPSDNIIRCQIFRICIPVLCHFLQGAVLILELELIELFVFTTDGHELSMNTFLNDLSIGQDEDSVDIPDC